MAKHRAALSTEVLLGVQACSPQEVEAHALLLRRGFHFAAPPTVVLELERILERGLDYSSGLARLALDTPKALDLVLGSFADLQKDVTEIHVARMLERRILGEEFSGDLSALIEAAYLDCLFFITSVPEVLAARGQLTLSLIQDCGMTSMFIFSPAEIAVFFREKHGTE